MDNELHVSKFVHTFSLFEIKKMELVVWSVIWFQHDTTKKTKRQKEANIAKKKELDVLQEELVISENDLSDIRKVGFIIQ